MRGPPAAARSASQGSDCGGRGKREGRGGSGSAASQPAVPCLARAVARVPVQMSGCQPSSPPATRSPCQAPCSLVCAQYCVGPLAYSCARHCQPARSDLWHCTHTCARPCTFQRFFSACGLTLLNIKHLIRSDCTPSVFCMPACLGTCPCFNFAPFLSIDATLPDAAL